MTNMNDNDSIEARLAEAAEQLVASFSHLDLSLIHISEPTRPY